MVYYYQSLPIFSVNKTVLKETRYAPVVYIGLTDKSMFKDCCCMS